MERLSHRTRTWIPFALVALALVLSGCDPIETATHNPEAAAARVTYGRLRVTGLRCEYASAPLAVARTQPRLGWRLTTDGDTHDQVQQAYQILVASEPNKLEPGVADLWDSGKVLSADCVHIPYAGKTLTSRRQCHWRVRVWDDEDLPSPWSAAQTWRMGLLHPGDWAGAEWIGLTEDPCEGSLRYRPFQTRGMQQAESRRTFGSPLLRRDFEVTKPLRTALATVAGLGYHELYLNGRRIGDHVLDPGQTSYDVHALYVTHDIREALSEGVNTVGLWLGNGFYGQNVAFTPRLAYGPPRAKAVLWLVYEDGSTETVITDGRWHSHLSPVLFDNVYAGETYDARLEQAGWARPGFPADTWPLAQIMAAPTERLDPQALPPIRRVRTLRPVTIKPVDPNRWIVDLGENIAGWLRLRVEQARGTIITVTYAEHLRPDGSAVDTESTGHFATGVRQQEIYVCRGDGPETWEPRFTYHGFRYAEIQGAIDPPTPDSVKGVVVHSDVAPRGSFACSEPLLNQMVAVSRRTILDNLHSVPEDCPHREKCGWTGDAHLMAETAIGYFDMARFFTKYLIDIEGVLGRGGRRYISREPSDAPIPPMVAPGKRLNLESTADWGVAIVLIPSYLRLYYGDRDIVDRLYPHMKAWAEHVWSRVDGGRVNDGLGDWCPPLWDRQTNPEAMECDPNISATCLTLEALRLLGGFATERGDGATAVWCREKRGQLLEAFNAATLHAVENTNAWTYGSQTADALALRYGLVPADKVRAVVNGLQWDIEVRHHGHHACGVFGLKHLYTVLAEHGQAELAYRVLTHPEFPSHAYTLGCGLTTWPERQFPMPDGEAYGDRSYNHPFHSGFATFFQEVIAGIRPDPAQPGYRHVILKPLPLGGLTWARAEHESLYGTIKSHWRIKNHAFIWSLEIPVNCTATVWVPGVQVVAPDGATPLDMRDGYVRFEVGSGQYLFTAQ